MSKIHKIGWKTAITLVVSNMVGTGVFTSLGFQLNDVQNVWSIVLLWVLGGVLALIGAFTFAELGTHYQKSGGDYIFISEGFHPYLGYLSAWTSMIVGFSAPVAIAAIAMEAYLSPFAIPHLRAYTVLIIVAISFFHSFSLKQSGTFQVVTTIIKIAFILLLLGLGIWFAPFPDNAVNTTAPMIDEVFKSGFAVSLLYVTYAYTGWNAAAYIVDEIDNPKKDLPKALIIGTISVIVIYVLLQLVFLKFASFKQLQGQTEVALIATGNILGRIGNRWISAGIAFQLIATMSSYIWIGPRIIHSMAQHYTLWKSLRPTNRHGIPTRAIWLQCSIILILMLSGTLQQILLYTSFLLQLMGTLAVASILGAPRKETSFKSPFRPYLQYAYIIFSVLVLLFIIWDKPFESLVGLIILIIGSLTYWISKQMDKK
jgi:APA family basic amino acid/polyamine antiporter